MHVEVGGEQNPMTEFQSLSKEVRASEQGSGNGSILAKDVNSGTFT